MGSSDLAQTQSIAVQSWDVPAFHSKEFNAKRSHYVIIIPVINEGKLIRAQLQEMNRQGITDTIDTVVIDGGSTDGSLDHSFLKQLGLRALLVKTGSGKLSAQLRCAYAWALQEGYDGIITIDGNGKDGVDTVPLFAAAMDDGIDYAQASRFVKGGHHENTPWSRLLAIRLIHAPLLSLAAGRWLTDTTQGYRAYSRRFLLDDQTQPFRPVFDRYELLAYLTVRASQLGYRVTEIPTSRVYPANEAIPTKISGVKALIDLLVVVSKTVLGRYNPKGRSRALGPKV
jgi:dolichol-phosphate mannosyltransferase